MLLNKIPAEEISVQEFWDAVASGRLKGSITLNQYLFETCKDDRVKSCVFYGNQILKNWFPTCKQCNDGAEYMKVYEDLVLFGAKAD